MSDGSNLIRLLFRTAVHPSRLFTIAIACMVLSGAVRAQVAATASASPASVRVAGMATASAAGGVAGATQDLHATELQRRTDLSHRRRSMQIEAANEQIQQLLATNQEPLAAATERHHRAAAGHRGTTSQGRRAARRMVRTPLPTPTGESTP